MRSSKTCPSPEPDQNSGQLALPLALLLSALTAAAVGILGLQELWRTRASLQLKLDRCAATQALGLRNIQRTIETQNSRMRVLRATKAAALAAAQAELVPPLDQALQLMVRLQDLERLRWVQLQVGATARRDCPHDLIRGPRIPEALPWIRPAPDPLGPRPLEWPKNRPRQISLHFKKRGLHSHATAYSNGSTWIATHLLNGPSTL